MSFKPEDLAIPLGSLVVVTGANGYIASNVVDQLLLAGYRVRGCVRSIDRAKWLQPLFDGKYGAGKFELVEVPDMGKEGAYDEAMVGAAGLCHVATPVMESPDPNIGVTVVVNGTLNALEAAAKEPSVSLDKFRFLFGVPALRQDPSWIAQSGLTHLLCVKI